MEPVGFLGLGVMGGAIAERLLGQGVPLIVYDPRPAAVEQALLQGASAGSSPRDVANRAATVIACLPSPSVCKAVALGPDGIATGGRITHYIETSTVGREGAFDISEQLRERGIATLDAPISGGAVAARTGSLTSIIAGPKSAIDDCRAVISCYSRTIFEVGAVQGAAQLAKLINNAIAISGMLAAFEGMAVADEASIDKAVLIDIINASSGANFATKVAIPEGLLASPPRQTARMEIFQKDISLYMDEARKMGLELPMASHAVALAKRAMDNSESDVAPALYDYFTRAARGDA